MQGFLSITLYYTGYLLEEGNWSWDIDWILTCQGSQEDDHRHPHALFQVGTAPLGGNLLQLEAVLYKVV